MITRNVSKLTYRCRLLHKMYSIAQDAARARLAYNLQCRANVYSMQLITFSAQCRIVYTDLSGALTYDVTWESQEPQIANSKLTIPIRFGIQVRSDEDVAVQADCTIRADYELMPEYQPGADEIEAFCESNAVFNCYPYFREFVQNTLSRMNYPPLSIPFLRLMPKAPAAKDAVIEHSKSLAGDSEGRPRRRLASRPRRVQPEENNVETSE